MNDFMVSNHGSIILLAPLTTAGQEWVDENMPEDAMTYGPSIVIELRYFSDIAEGIVADGLTLG